jgi:TonB family protein
MNPILYFGKVMIVSGILLVYYWAALRNKRFHLYNRFYLLATVMISLVLPAINLSFFNNHPTGAAKILHIISVSGWEDSVVITPQRHWLDGFLTFPDALYVLFTAIGFIMAGVLVKSILSIINISKKYHWENIDGIRVFFTSEPQSPFSFFKNIFWNQDLDISSRVGNQVLRHEIYHVCNYHSADILFLEMIKCICWFNPFFHFIKKELTVIHEFLADEYAVSGSETYGYAELLVWRIVSSKQVNIVNTFFQNQIKRRIAMITQQKNKRYHYLSRVMVLPVLFILFCAFGTRIGNLHPGPVVQAVWPAAPGGDDSLYHSVEHFLEKHLNYPPAGLQENQVATVNVRITVDASGKCSAAQAVESIPADMKYYAITVQSRPTPVHARTKQPVVEAGFNQPAYIPFKETVTKSMAAFRSDLPVTREVTMYFRVSFRIEQNALKSALRPAASTGASSFVRAPQVDPAFPDNAAEHPNKDTLTPRQFEQLNMHDIKNLRVDSERRMIVIYLKSGDSATMHKDEFDKYEKDHEGERTKNNDMVFTKVEVEADYPGGEQGWRAYLINTLKYPEEAVKNEIQGIVVVKYIIDKDGSVSDVQAESGPATGGLREEAVRVVKNSGKWIPARQNGRNVRAYKRQPIAFSLNSK